MSDEWQVGDRALCVADELPGFGFTRRVVVGRVYIVEGMYVSQAKCYEGLLALIVEGVRGGKYPGLHHALFRKLSPHAPDEFDRETIALLNGKPAREMA